MNIVVDARGKACPQPVVMTKKALDNVKSGRITVLVDNEIACQNVSKFAKNAGFSYTLEESDGKYEIVINKSADAEPELVPETRMPENLPESGSYCILITKKTLGKGPDELGTLLMKSFFTALNEASNLPSNIFFLNEGVYLTTQGSECSDLLLELEKRGVAILSCGTCLDYYNLKDKIVVGRVTNMYDIVDTITKTRTITL